MATQQQIILRVENGQGITIGDLRQLFDAASDFGISDSTFLAWSIGGESNTRRALVVQIATNSWRVGS